MKLHFNYITLCLLLVSGFIYGQQEREVRANSKYNSMSYTEAISLYKGLVADGYGSPELFENLGNSYYLQSNYSLARVSYDSLFKRTKDVSKSTYYRYINVLRSEKEDKKADKLYATLLKKYPKEKIEDKLKNRIFLSPEVLGVSSVTLKNSKINSPYSDYKVSYLGEDKIAYSSSKETKSFLSTKSIWNNEAYTNLYESRFDGDSLIGEVSKLKGRINRFYNESSAVFTKDGKTMYFTRNNHLANQVKTDSLENVLLKIYKAKYNGKRWVDIEELPFNSNQYNCAHPALSPDEDYLYFSSDMPGTKGESDLYRVSIIDNTYGTPENLGAQINTLGRDTFPFITSDNVLIFSSDYRKGQGGLDLYYTDLKSTNKRVYTFSAPINSSFDDFGLVYKVSEGTGFMSSNRKEDNVGSDDIYALSGLSIPKLEDLTVMIKSKKGNDVIGNTSVTLLNENKSVLGTITAINNQVSLLDVDPSKGYNLQVNNENYQPYASSLKFKGTNTTTIYLTEKAPPPAPVDLLELLKLENIYFDFDKHAIRSDAAIELAKIVEILNRYPVINLEIIGHTDSFGPAAYNERLSARRAASTKQWLVDRGISADRITTFGYGEKQPINDCERNKCTKEQHNQNRRTEFLIKQ
ncbi:OmpA family protein [uncultured Polaribacter sp.]|uniref:OmpA family protein n=1 Tax=uncultured Polaribacter sp. TaxID=174711 RepID=UPI0026306825|nr:OmpA family protein [uncultured Polaribacter sp.]